MNTKGVTLLLVLVLILVVVILANIALVILRSHSKLTHHQVSRIQGFYAAQAGMNYALEMFRLGPGNGGWPTPLPDNPVTYTICAAGCDVIENEFPHTIQQVEVVVSDDEPVGGDGIIEISSTATYD